MYDYVSTYIHVNTYMYIYIYMCVYKSMYVSDVPPGQAFAESLIGGCVFFRVSVFPHLPGEGC